MIQVKIINTTTKLYMSFWKNLLGLAAPWSKIAGFILNDGVLFKTN